MVLFLATQTSSGQVGPKFKLSAKGYERIIQEILRRSGYYFSFVDYSLNFWFLILFFCYLFIHSFQARYDGKLLRPMSAPVRRIISLMDNEEPVFGKTHQHFDPQLKDVYPHKGLRKTFHLFFKLSIFNT